MPGIRLRHPELRACMFTVIHHGRPYPVPWLCHICKQAHEFKTYHLELDGNGEVVVSETILGRLREAELAPLAEVGIEPDPEPLVIGGRAVPGYHVVEREA